jgi:hypothetical protein
MRAEQGSREETIKQSFPGGSDWDECVQDATDAATGCDEEQVGS